MEVKVLKYTGHEEARLGLSLAYKDPSISLEDWWNSSKQERYIQLASQLANKDFGHNKFLESIQLWVYVKAPRNFWQEFDTYRVGVTKQSESTMHTITKRYLTPEDFNKNNVPLATISFINGLIDHYNDTTSREERLRLLESIKDNLPEGFLQSRLVNMNLKTLRNMYLQRKNHRLFAWKEFFEELSKYEGLDLEILFSERRSR